MARMRISSFNQSAHQSNAMDSKKVFALRKEGKLQDAYNLAVSLLNSDKDDEWNKRAMAWVLVDIIKLEINKNLQNAIAFFNQLISLKIQDDVLETQIKYLQSRLTPVNSEIEKASALSKSGSYLNALNQFRQIFKNNTNLFQAHHDAYGWAIYRYLKNEFESISSIEVKRILFEYNNLQSERPSMLHSQILRFVINYVRYNQDIDIYKYFLNWDPSNLMDEDTEKNNYDGKVYDSVLENLVKAFVYSPSHIDFDLLDQKIVVWHNLPLIDIYRESIFWQIFNAHKENQLSRLWQLFDNYATNYSKYGPSHWHSEILNLAQRFMTENNLWRFPQFLQNWDVTNFQNSDWRGDVYNDKPTKSLVAKALSNIYEYSKTANNPKDLEWILPFYKEATERLSDDIWLLRGYSNLLSLTGRQEQAIEVYNKVLLNLNNQAYAWHELSKLIKSQDINLAHSMLCMAISKQPKEDFLGDIRLDLAELLINKGMLDEAKRELITYEEFRQSKRWKISDRYNQLYSKVESASSLEYDKDYYRSHSNIAEAYLYKDIEWQPFLTYRSWTSKKNNEEMIAISNLKDIELAFKKSKYPTLKQSQVNEVISCKVYFDKAKDRYNILIAEKSDVTYEDFIDKASTAIAVVDHINQEKKLFHYYFNDTVEGIIRFSDTDLRPNIGDCLSIKYFMSFNSKSNKKEAQIVKVSATSETNPSLIKTVQGIIKLKYKHSGRTLEFHESLDSGLDVAKPDFAFIDDYYVHRKILNKYKINSNRDIKAKVINERGKWSVIDLIDLV
ncbi:tetratricopeptide repeat protein [uncultured Psychrobacter sp.]|uniref:tetratricopeptide repeat protein n=1 Tax=uncultured Psychrobacter sp. TaxID=259303 RepID=UPI00345AFBF2